LKRHAILTRNPGVDILKIEGIVLKLSAFILAAATAHLTNYYLAILFFIITYISLAIDSMYE